MNNVYDFYFSTGNNNYFMYFIGLIVKVRPLKYHTFQLLTYVFCMIVVGLNDCNMM
jgi:hypothetical protein